MYRPPQDPCPGLTVHYGIRSNNNGGRGPTSGLHGLVKTRMRLHSGVGPAGTIAPDYGSGLGDDGALAEIGNEPLLALPYCSHLGNAMQFHCGPAYNMR